MQAGKRRAAPKAVRAALTLCWILLVVGGAVGCRRGQSCDGVPTTADGCRERCHDRGAEMAFFRYEPGEYRCDAVCECEP